ncbi:hypothetical protein DFS34DRAFT_598480 [Phlyctochytrium arcticum]|nr:hypothetical protein DFS34DRAFT_598480 [Phlyctochytrium arcticum]
MLNRNDLILLDQRLEHEYPREVATNDPEMEDFRPGFDGEAAVATERTQEPATLAQMVRTYHFCDNYCLTNDYFEAQCFPTQVAAFDHLSKVGNEVFFFANAKPRDNKSKTANNIATIYV